MQEAAREARYAAAEQLRARARRRVDRDRPHPHRPRRDDALPARLSRRGAARCSGCPPRRGYVVRPLLAIGPRRDAAPRRPRPACPSPTTPPTSTPASPGSGSARRCCPCCARSTPRRSRTLPPPGPSWRRRPRRWTRLPPRPWRTPVPGPRRQRCRPSVWRSCAPALRRLALRALAERAAGRERGAGAGASRADLAPCQPSGGRRGRSRGRPAGDLRGGDGALLRPRPRPSRSRPRWPVPGSCRFGRWQVRAELQPGPVGARRPRRRDARRRGARRPARGARLARRRPHAAARPRRHQVPSGPVHRQPRAALAAPRAAGCRRRRSDRLGRRGRGLGGVQALARARPRPRCSPPASPTERVLGSRHGGSDGIPRRPAHRPRRTSASPTSTRSRRFYGAIAEVLGLEVAGRSTRLVMVDEFVLSDDGPADRRAFTSPSRPPTGRRSIASTRPRWRPAGPTTGRQASATITPAITRPMSSTRTATTLRLSTTGPRSARRPMSSSHRAEPPLHWPR